jgi:hypothetical protein
VPLCDLGAGIRIDEAHLDAIAPVRVAVEDRARPLAGARHEEGEDLDRRILGDLLEHLERGRGQAVHAGLGPVPLDGVSHGHVRDHDEDDDGDDGLEQHVPAVARAASRNALGEEVADLAKARDERVEQERGAEARVSQHQGGRAADEQRHRSKGEEDQAENGEQDAHSAPH